VRQHLLVNKEKIVTPYDLYETLLHIPLLPLLSTPPNKKDKTTQQQQKPTNKLKKTPNLQCF